MAFFRALRLFQTPLDKIQALKVHIPKDKNVLQITFSNNEQACLSSEWLRVNSLAADQRMPGPSGEGIQPVFGKANVKIQSVKPVGNYALSVTFSDKHNTGVYSYKHLYQLHKEKPQRMRQYIETLKAHGLSRFPRTGKKPGAKKIVHDPTE
jgi:DUF971 family protein